MILTADPKHVNLVTFGGKTFHAGQATYGNLLDSQEALDRHHPGAIIRVIQPCYNTGVTLSAGTHDKDAVLDVEILGMTWTDAQAFLRRQGWAAWWRHAGDWAARTAWHIHMVSLGAFEAGCPVGLFIPAQVADYRNHAQGLAGQHTPGSDPTWHPADIDSTVFDYHAWRQDMPYSNWPEADKKELVADVSAAVRDSVLNADMNALDPKGSPKFKGVSLRDAIKKIATKVGAV